MKWLSRTAVALVGLLLGSGCEDGWCNGPIASCFPDLAKQSTMGPGNMTGAVDMADSKPPCIPKLWIKGATASPQCTMSIVNETQDMVTPMSVTDAEQGDCYMFIYFNRNPGPKFDYQDQTGKQESTGIGGVNGAPPSGGFFCKKINKLSKVIAGRAPNDSGAYSGYIEVFKGDGGSCSGVNVCK